MAPPVSGYVGWWDSTQITHVPDDAQLTTWPDLSGNGINWTQSNQSLAPTYNVTFGPWLINGLPTVYFNGPSVYMTSPFVTQAQPFTWYVVGTVNYNGSQPNVPVLLSSASCTLGMDYLANGAYGGFMMNAGTELVYPNFDRNPHVFSAQFHSGASQLHITTTVTGNAGTNSMSGAMVLGNTPTFNSGWVGPIGEIIVYPFGMTLAQDTLIYDYLYGKWINTISAVLLGPLTTVTIGAIGGGGALALAKVTVLE